MATNGTAAIEELLSNVGLLERLCRVGMGTEAAANPAEILDAQAKLTEVREYPLSYLKVPDIITNSNDASTRFFSLTVLEKTVASRWNVISAEEKVSIRTFVMQFIAHLVCNGHLRDLKFLVIKADAVLVAIAKREWPQRWPGFIEEMVSTALNSAEFLENNLLILKLLSEELFEFEEKQMTSRWIQRRREALRADFQSVFNLCAQALGDQFGPELQRCSLQTLETYISRLPQQLVLSADFLALLSEKFVRLEITHLSALKCLNEVAQLRPTASEESLIVATFTATVRSMVDTIPLNPSNPLPLEQRVTTLFHQGAGCDQQRLEICSRFIAHAMRNNYRLLLTPDAAEIVVEAHRLLIGVTAVDSVEFKDMVATATEYWRWFSELLVVGTARVALATKSGFNRVLNNGPGGVAAGSKNFNVAASPGKERQPLQDVQLPGLCPSMRPQREMIRPLLETLRIALIRAMIKPEEVIIVEDDNGQLQTTYLNDVEALQQYSTMRQVLIFVTLLDTPGMVSTTRTLLARQIDRSEWGWCACNKICWSIGALSGSMQGKEEDDYFVAVLRDLLDFCAKMPGKENKAVIASNIMYIVGQYPRFLMRHPRFFRTVCRKLFDFMKETFPGIKDMAADTILKLARLIPEAFVVNSPSPFAFDIAESIGFITVDLNPGQLHTFYEAMGLCVGCMEHEAPLGIESERDRLLRALLKDVVQAFEAGVQRVQAGQVQLGLESEMSGLLHILRTISSFAKTSGPGFMSAMNTLFQPMQQYYITYSNMLKAEVEAHGQLVTNRPEVRLIRAIKREFLRIIEHFVASTDKPQYVSQQCWPLLMGPILEDYKNSPPNFRDATLLSVLAVCVERLKGHLAHETANILDGTFETTKDMIAGNFQDFPDHRINLFRLLEALDSHCFEALLSYTSSHHDVIKGLLWAIKHQETSVMTAGLNTLSRFLVQVVHSPMGDAFFGMFYNEILLEVMAGLTDTLHTQGFRQHAEILSTLFDASAGQESNVECPYHSTKVAEFLSEKLRGFPSLQPTQISQFVQDCFRLRGQHMAFTTLLSDFLVESQVWGSEMENAMLEEEERSKLQGAQQVVAQLVARSYVAADHFQGEDE